MSDAAEADTAAVEAAMAPVAPSRDSWQVRQAVLQPKQEELIERGLKLMEEAEEMIRNGEPEKGLAMLTLASSYIHLG